MRSDLRSDSPDLRDLMRREALGALALGLPASAAFARQGSAGTARARIAAIVTEYWKASHGQGIVDRFLDGYGWEGQSPPAGGRCCITLRGPETIRGPEPGAGHAPSRIDDLSHDRRGSDQGRPELAVDGVLIIGEHGNYPRNEKGQTLYPRYEFFQQVVDVFRRHRSRRAGLQR